METVTGNEEILKNATTIDKTEVNKFSTNCDNWWEGSRKALHALNDIRVPYICKKVSEWRTADVSKPEEDLQGLNVLDTGCGGGILAEALAKCGANVIGIDVSPELIQVAKEHVNRNPLIKDKVQYIATSIEEYAVDHKETADVVVSSEVVEHVNNPEKFVKHCCELLKPGGSIIITTINKTWWAWLSTIVYLEWITGTIRRGTHNWNFYISPEEVTGWVNMYGCENVTVQGSKLNSSPISWELQSSTSSFYMLHAVKRKN